MGDKFFEHSIHVQYFPAVIDGIKNLIIINITQCAVVSRSSHLLRYYGSQCVMFFLHAVSDIAALVVAADTVAAVAVAAVAVAAATLEVTAEMTVPAAVYSAWL